MPNGLITWSQTARLGDLKPHIIQDYIANKLKTGRLDGKGGLSPKSVHQHYLVIHGSLEKAMKWQFLGRNPCDNVTPPKFAKPELKILDGENLNRVLAEAKRRYPYLYPLYFTLLSTGARRSECLGLRWEDIDFSKNQVRITRALHHLMTGETIFSPPKSPRSRRTVALPGQCSLVLRAYKEQREMECATLGYELVPDALVFADATGKPLLPDTVTHVWTKLVRRLGLRGVRLHDARHSHVSHLISLGVDVKTISERVGHASVATTLDVYGHLLPNAQAIAAAKFDEVLTMDRPGELTAAD